MERIQSGISGFDKLVGGGIPKNDLIMLSGTCGSGKTIFSLQFLCSYVMREPGIYVSFEEELEKIRQTARNFGWKIDEMEKIKKLQLLKYDPFKIEDIFEVIEGNIREIGAKRVVIDSVSSLGLYMKDKGDLRRMILQISSMLRKNSCTSIMISETLPGTKGLSRFGVEEFVADGVVKLERIFSGGEYRHGITVWKMRSTRHSDRLHPYKITKDGFAVFSNDTLVIDV